ncbi:hypothetical protein BCV72DRAFT_16204 [Rhizopus microsporus var. microsporus]|uniref:F-box domain-containing protein n=1 Tax=Rhizopus microsporus var. microsporus TaxID=86635 RepID=A0A1X0REY0_RHIZD|nr:hypothetical protein BCV72DRAFT_16204 [Rhizopus microsporus var. microsporus]
MKTFIDELPFEIILQIFQHVPLSTFNALYSVFPQALVDEALVFKLRNNKSKPLLNLVSTNLHELSTDVQSDLNKRNESSLFLYFASFDPYNRFIWTVPDFCSFQHYFRVKDAYVSHGKLVIRHPSDSGLQKPLLSLWDIRKSFPPVRAGSFSGASEYSTKKVQQLTIHQLGCILDTCLIPTSNVAPDGIIMLHNVKSEDKDAIKRPALPNYVRKISPSTISSWLPIYPDPTCGYFLVERLAISISTFLELCPSAFDQQFLCSD